jgi:hypothetical protein
MTSNNDTPPLDPIRALRIIEGLVIERSDDGGIFGLIYTIAHAGGEHSCHKNHPDFVTTALETEKKLVEGRLIDKWGEV